MKSPLLGANWAAALALLLAIAATCSSMHGVDASSTLNGNVDVCPTCHVNATLTFKSTSGAEVTAPNLSDNCQFVSNGFPVCTGCGNSSSLVSCYGAPGSTFTSSCVDVLTDPNNCGACGNSCNGGSCSNGRCTCDPSDPFSCTYGAYYCNNVTNIVPKCEPNPVGKCPPSNLTPHNASDFTASLYTDAACSSCGDVCDTAANQTCVQNRAGSYKCAQQCSQTKCPSDTPFCVGGACVQCTTSNDCLSGEVCNLASNTCVPGCRSTADCQNPAKPFCDTSSNTCGACLFSSVSYFLNYQNQCPPQSFCSNAADTKNQCLACPSGTYSLKMKYGNASDCTESLDAAHGQVSNCGGFNVPTNNPTRPPALTCCHGTPKCGTFADPTNGTDAECGVLPFFQFFGFVVRCLLA